MKADEGSGGRKNNPEAKSWRAERSNRGNYKTQPNNVAAFDEAGKQVGIVFETASPFDTPQRMSELIAWTSDAYSSRRLHPLPVTAIFTVVLLEIHPFQDGNGRLSRILTTLLLLRAGYSYVPYSSLESVIEQSKEGYYLALRETQVTVRTEAPNWQPWVMFFLRALQQQMKRLAKKVERERIVLAALPVLSVRIIEHANDLELIGKYRKEGPCHNVLANLRTLRNERLAHRQTAPSPATAPGASATDEEIEEFYQDNSKLVQILLSLVKAMAYDPQDTAGVYGFYAKSFWERFQPNPRKTSG